MAVVKKPAAKNYGEIAKRKISSPTQLKNKRLPRILVYGRNKKGKTTFMASAGQGKVLILDPEHGTDEMTKSDPDVWPIDSWEDIDEAYKFLKLGNHDYDWVALDGMTKIHNMALRWVMLQEEEHDLTRRPGLVQQRDYGKAGEMVKAILWNYHALPMGVAFSAQERVERMGEGDEADDDIESSSVAFVPDLPKGARSTLNSIVSVIGRIYTVRGEWKVRNKETQEVEIREGLRRRLWLEPDVRYDTGYRSEYELPRFLEQPTIPKLVKLMREGKIK